VPLTDPAHGEMLTAGHYGKPMQLCLPLVIFNRYLPPAVQQN
jgi:hypothetical protein